jgi:zinc transport system substrate-binding protein
MKNHEFSDRYNLPPFPMNCKNPLLLIVAMLSALSCSKTSLEPLKPLIVVSIPPQKFFVQKIAGDLVDVLVMIPPGSSPHTYEPKPVQMAALSKAKAYFAIGVEFEKAWLERLAKTSPSMMIVHTDSGIAKQPMQEGPGREAQSAHDHEGLDPHIWLAPELVKQQAAIITQALSRLFPSHEADFRRNDSLFAIDITLLQDSVRLILSARTPVRSFMVFHPSWGYFAREFHLRQIDIEVEGKEPSPSELGTIFDSAKRFGITTIYIQPQFSKRSAEVIARQIGAHLEIADPLAFDWRENLLRCAHALSGERP